VIVTIFTDQTYWAAPLVTLPALFDQDREVRNQIKINLVERMNG
jgi:hypothetical protein